MFLTHTHITTPTAHERYQKALMEFVKKRDEALKEGSCVDRPCDLCFPSYIVYPHHMQCKHTTTRMRQNTHRNPPKPPKKPPILNGANDIIVSDGGKFNDDKHRRYLLAQVRCSRVYCKF